MAVTRAFQEAIERGDLLRVRIMLKDSLLIDITFKQFREMQRYAERKNANLWMEQSEVLVKEPPTSWNKELMNRELVKLTDEFTEERVGYCQKIIRKVYNFESPQSTKKQETHLKSSTKPAKKKQQTGVTPLIGNWKSVNKLSKEVERKTSRNGWTVKEVKEVLSIIEKMKQLCEEMFNN